MACTKTQRTATSLESIGAARLQRLLRLAVAALLLGAAAPARALTIPFIDVYTETLTVTGVGAGGAATVVLATGRLFPSALGTLEDVDLQFSGSVSFIVATGLNMQAGASPSPLPYPVQPQLSIRIDGLTDLYELQPFELGTLVAASGAGESAVIFGTYSFKFSYHDVLGQFIGPQGVNAWGPIAFSSPFALSGQLDDFDSGQAVTNNLVLSYMLSFTEAGRVSSDPTVVTAVNSLMVMTTYTYSAPPLTVPEPGNVYLLLAGIAALAAARRSWTFRGRRAGVASPPGPLALRG